MIFLKVRYSDHELFIKAKKEMQKNGGLFENLLLAFKTADDALDKQIADVRKKDEHDVEAQVKNLATNKGVIKV